MGDDLMAHVRELKTLYLEAVEKAKTR